MKQSGVFILAVVGSLVLLNVLAINCNAARLDITRDKSYALSQATKDSLAGLEDPVTVTAYFTKDLPVPYSSNARYLRDMLDEFRSSSKGKVAYQFIDPLAEETDADKQTKRDVKVDIFGREFRDATSVERELMGMGIQPVEVPVASEDQRGFKRAYMALVLKYQEKKEVVPVVQNLSTLEYDLTSLIRKMTRSKTPVVAVLQGNGAPVLHEKLNRLQAVLSQTYQVRGLELQGKTQVDDDVDAVLVIGPKTALPPNEVKAIDQFLMKGKSVGFFLDSIQLDLKTFESTPAEHGLAPLLSTYGVTIGDELVASVDSQPINVQQRMGFMIVATPKPYPFLPIIRRLEGDSPITKGLGGLIFPFSSKVTATASEGRQATVLARSSPKSWLEKKPYNIDPRREWNDVTVAGSQDLMVQVTGKLKSHYASEASTSSNTGQAPVLAESSGEARVVVIGGSTLFQDDAMAGPNAVLLQNISDWLLLDPAMLAIRSRAFSVAPLDPDLTVATRTIAKVGNTVGAPLLLVIYGLFRWWQRRTRRQSLALS